MRDLKNPNDSLQDYFDELLLDSLPEAAPKSTPELNFPPLEVVVPEAKNKSESRAAEIVVTETIATQKVSAEPSVVSHQFADPLAKQREVLQKLLRSAQPKIEVAPVEKITVTAPVTFKADPVEIQEWDIATVTPTIIETATNVDVATAQAEVEQTYHMPGLEWLPNGLPQWAQAKFDVLLIKVSGLTLAVPLVSLGQIQPITDELTHIFGQADWFIGIQPTQLGKIRVVNTAKFVMPDRYDENFVKTAKFLVSIDGVPWGLAVDAVNQPISLDPEEVRWRSDRTKRPWLAGIIKEQMCVLLDIPMIGQMLMESDKNLSKNHV